MKDQGYIDRVCDHCGKTYTIRVSVDRGREKKNRTNIRCCSPPCSATLISIRRKDLKLMSNTVVSFVWEGETYVVLAKPDAAKALQAMIEQFNKLLEAELGE